MTDEEISEECYMRFLENDDKIDAKARMRRDHGTTSKHHHAVIGCNYRLSSMHAAVLSARLKRLDNLECNEASQCQSIRQGFRRT